MVKTNKQQYNRRHGFKLNESHKVPRKVIQEVYERGVGAHKTNPSSVRLKASFKKDPKAPISAKLSKEQWGMARVYSFVNKIKGPKKLNHDTDLIPF